MNENHQEADDEHGLEVQCSFAVVFPQQAVQLVQQVSDDEVAADENRSGTGQYHVQQHCYGAEVAAILHRHVNRTKRHH